MNLKSLSNTWTLVATAFQHWLKSDPWRQSASIAYYAIFSMPGLLIIVIWSAGILFGEQAVQGQVSSQLQQYLGPDSASSIQTIIANARITDDKLWMKTLGIATLLIGSTTLFLQLQKTLNEIWGVRSAPKNGFLKLLADRATSLGIILVIAFLLLVSLLLSAFLSMIAGWVEAYFGETWLILIRVLNFLLSLSVISFLFAVLFRVLPDVEIGWKPVWVGAILSAVLFTLGETILGLYLGYAEPGSSFGAAGTIILVMLWVNYTSLILFFGAQVSRSYSDHQGLLLEPSTHAEWLPEEKSRK